MYLAWILLFTPVAHAEPWQDLMTDIELYNQQMQMDTQDSEEQLRQAERDDSTELFPIEEGVEIDPTEDYALSETHLTIKVDGIPVVLDDVPLFEWFAPYVRDVANRNLISGYRSANGLPSGLFGPADNVTIEQLAKMSVIAANVDEYACDTDQLRNESAVGKWSERYIACAEDLGWAVYSDGSVDVARAATREEVVVTVLQAFEARISPRTGTVFNDVTGKTRYGGAVETAAEQGIVSGYADQFGNPTLLFGPEDFVTRAATAKIFALAFQVYGQ